MANIHCHSFTFIFTQIANIIEAGCALVELSVSRKLKCLKDNHDD